MTSSLVGIREKIKRADQHIRNVSKTVKAFRDKCECTVVHEYDPNTPRHTYRLSVSKKPRVSLRRVSIVSGEAVHQLRSVLDHLVCQLAIREANIRGVKPPRLNDLAWPVFDKEPACEKQIVRFEGMIKGLSPAAKAEIQQLQPYNPANGGPKNYPLCALNKLNNTDKHRLLLVVAASAAERKRSLNITPETIGHIAELFGHFFKPQEPPPIGFGKWIQLEDGAEICPPHGGGPDVKMDIEASVGIAIQGASPAELHPVVPRLDDLRNFVVGVVEDFEAKFF